MGSKYTTLLSVITSGKGRGFYYWKHSSTCSPDMLFLECT